MYCSNIIDRMAHARKSMYQDKLTNQMLWHLQMEQMLKTSDVTHNEKKKKTRIITTEGERETEREREREREGKEGGRERERERKKKSQQVWRIS
jgi:hypothetical protein